jgi:hypothetical protein
VSERKVPAALTKTNIGEVVEVRTWKQFTESRKIEENSERLYTGRLKSFAIHDKGVLVNISGMGLINVAYEYGDHIEVTV